MTSAQKTMVKDVISPDSIMETALAFQKSRILLTAHELGLFTALGEERKTSGEVAKVLRTGDQATDRLMNALCVMGLLNKNEGRFSTSPLASRFLVKDKPEFMAGLMHSVYLWDTWSTLTKAVRRGKSVIPRNITKQGKKRVSAFIAAMHSRARQQASGIVSLLDMSDVRHVLDVGGGSGEYSMAFVRAKEGSRATVLDLANVIPLTRSYIEKEGLSDKVKTVTADYKIDALGSGFDMIFLSAIIHSNSPEENLALLRKAAEALNPHGQVVVLDFIVNEDRTGPAFSALFALNMLVATESGDTYTESEVRTWMEQAGLSGIIRKDTAFGTSLIIGKKRG